MLPLSTHLFSHWSIPLNTPKTCSHRHKNCYQEIDKKSRAPTCCLKASLHFTSVIFCNIFHQINHKHTGSLWCGCPPALSPKAWRPCRPSAKYTCFGSSKGTEMACSRSSSEKQRQVFQKAAQLLIYICRFFINDAGFVSSIHKYAEM